MFDPRKIDTKLLIEAVPYLSMIEMQAIKHPNPQLPGDNGTVLSGSGLQDASLPRIQVHCNHDCVVAFPY